MKFAIKISMVILLVNLSSSCVTFNTPAELYQKIADQMREKAKAKQLAKAIRKSEKEEKHKAKFCLDDRPIEQGKLEEKIETDVNFKLQNGIEFVDFSLDFEEIEKLKKRQAKYDKEYEEAQKAWQAYEDERERRYLNLKREHAKLQSNLDVDQDGCAKPVTQNCSIPPLTAYVKTEPPERRAVGIEEIPIQVRMNVKINAGGPTYAQSKINRTFIPAKQAKESCCSKCGTQGCVDSCTSCGFTPVNNLSNLAPPAPAMIEKIGLSTQQKDQ